MAIFNFPVAAPAPAPAYLQARRKKTMAVGDTQSGGVMYLGSPHPIHPSIHPSISIQDGFFPSSTRLL
jgi:hypothetical protein